MTCTITWMFLKMSRKPQPSVRNVVSRRLMKQTNMHSCKYLAMSCVGLETLIPCQIYAVVQTATRNFNGILQAHKLRYIIDYKVRFPCRQVAGLVIYEVEK